MNLVIVQL